jgi:hypothetical protein
MNKELPALKAFKRAPFGGDMWIEPAAGARFVIRLPMDHTDCALGRAASSENVSIAIR